MQKENTNTPFKKRNFYLDIKPSENGQYCLQISTSSTTSHLSLPPSDSSITLFEEDLFRFSQALSKVISKFPMTDDTRKKFEQSRLFEENL